MKLKLKKNRDNVGVSEKYSSRCISPGMSIQIKFLKKKKIINSRKSINIEKK